MSTKVIITKNASKEERAKAIAAALEAKKNAPVVTTPAAAKDAKAAKANAELKVRIAARKETAKPDDAATKTKVDKPAPTAKDPNMLSISDVARELNMDPKQARAKLRRKFGHAPEGRWQKVVRGSKEHQDLVAIIEPEQPEQPDDEDEEEAESSDE